jgi:hypothetical protein
MHNFDSINRKLLGSSSDLLRSWLPGGHFESKDYVALNPTREDRHKGSFRINVRTGQWIDHATSDKGTGLLSLYAYIHQIKLGEAFQRLDNNIGGDLHRLAKVAKVAKEKPQNFLSIWNEACDIQNTIAQKYLHSREITIHVEDDTLRYHPKLWHASSKHFFPGLIAAARCWPCEKIIAIHRTFLDPVSNGKANICPNKMILGPISGCAVRFGKDLGHIIVAEGIETALSIYQETGMTTWAALSATNIPNIILPPRETTRFITLALDNDKAGIESGKKAAKQWVTEGREVKKALPPVNKDFNDLIRG